MGGFSSDVQSLFIALGLGCTKDSRRNVGKIEWVGSLAGLFPLMCGGLEGYPGD